MNRTKHLGFLALALLALAGCGRPFTPATPPGFVDLGDNYPDGEYRATTADGAVIGVRAYDNEPRGELAFWTRALENRMRESGGYALLEKRVHSRGQGALVRVFKTRVGFQDVVLDREEPRVEH